MFLLERIKKSKYRFIIAIGLSTVLTILSWKIISDTPYLLENPSWVINRPSDEVLIQSLPSVKNINYSLLKNQLQTQQWQNADQETRKILGKAMPTGRELLFYQESDIQKIPCTDLLTLDRLWTKFSNRKFGFSIQREILNTFPNPEEVKQLCLKKCPVATTTVNTLEISRCKWGCENERIQQGYIRILEKMGRGKDKVDRELPPGYYPSPIEIVNRPQADTYREFAKRSNQCKI